MKVAVFGASGFVGNSVINRLSQNDQIEVIAVIHSDGNAWALSKDSKLTIKQVNILDKSQVSNVLKDVTHVVNCTRGSDQVMREGFTNLLNEAIKAKVKNFVHLSSVLIYGERPSAESVFETAKPDPQDNHYAKLKLYQDNLIQASIHKGLHANIICPPNIIGPGSYFLDGLLGMLKNGSFAMLENGQYACATVDVENVAKSIECALLNGDGSGKRFFVTDDEIVSWAQVVENLQLLAAPFKIISTSKDELELRSRKASLSYNPLRSIRHLVSSDVREALRKDPLLCEVDHFFRGLVAKLPSNMEDKIRLSVEGATVVAKSDKLNKINWSFCSSQLRNVNHSCNSIKTELGYKPEHSFSESMEAYRAHFKHLHGYNTDFERLLRYIN